MSKNKVLSCLVRYNQPHQCPTPAVQESSVNPASRSTQAQSGDRRKGSSAGAKMQCFICVMYMFLASTAYPRHDIPHDSRSLFHDVIQSLKIRAQLPEDTNRNDENNLGQIYERYGYENDELHLPNDAEFTPRRNDRIALPPLKYRVPKMLSNNRTEINVTNKDSTEQNERKEEFVIFISTTEVPKVTTQKKTKTTKQPNKKPNLGDTDDGKKQIKVPVVNTMADQSHIGNKQIHMVVTPNIVLNFRSQEDNKDSFIKFEEGKNSSVPEFIPQNIFNIHQEIKLDKDMINDVVKTDKLKDLKRVKQEIKVVSRDVKQVEEDMMMCETATLDPEKNNRTERKLNNVLQILLSL